MHKCHIKFHTFLYLLQLVLQQCSLWVRYWQNDLSHISASHDSEQRESCIVRSTQTLPCTGCCTYSCIEWYLSERKRTCLADLRASCKCILFHMPWPYEPVLPFNRCTSKTAKRGMPALFNQVTNQLQVCSTVAKVFKRKIHSVEHCLTNVG